MKANFTMTRLAFVTAALLFACEAEPVELDDATSLDCDAASDVATQPVDAAATDAGQDTASGDAPIAVEPTCYGSWREGPLPEPWWHDSSPATCVSVLSCASPRLYDDCWDRPVDVLTPEQCGAPERGAVHCVSNGVSDIARITLSCLTDGDCPVDMACVTNEGIPASIEPIDPNVSWAGRCEKRCDGTGGPGECIRCDLECWTEYGVCGQLRDETPPQPCVNDCECGGICDQGFCNDDVTVPNSGLCPNLGCSCEGGTCRADGCCILPDGSVAPPEHEVCQAP